MCRNDQQRVTLQIWGALLQPVCQDQQFNDLSSIFSKKTDSLLNHLMWSIQKCRPPKVICGLRTCSVLTQEGRYSPSGVLARRYESLAAVKSSLFKIPAKSNSFHAVTNHWSLFPLQADSYSLQLSSDCALLVPADSNYLSSSSLSSFHGEPEKQMTKGPRWGSNLILSSWDEKTMQRLQGKDRKIYVFKKKNGGGKREIEGPGGQSHQCEGRNVQKVHV